MPRRYYSQKRKEAVAETRLRIVEATVQLHGEKGALATTFQDVAARADVALATVYRYFPTREDLLPVCTAHAREMYPAPTSAIFDGLETPSDRIPVLIRKLFADYAQMEPWMDATLWEQRTLPFLRGLVSRAYAAREQLVVEAMAHPAEDDRAFRMAVALTDFYAWKSLRRAGLEPEQAVEEVTALLLSRLQLAPSPKEAP